MSKSDTDALTPQPPSGIFKVEFVVLIASMMALNALAIDIMVPALDDIGRAFAVANANDQQLVMLAYVIGFGVPQLIWGPVSDRYGRRALLLISLIGYAALSWACVLASSFSELLLARFVMGVFSSAGRVVAVSVVRDVYAGRGMAEICLLYTSPSPRDRTRSRMPSSA